ncbi:ABC transporter substrate-binding protein [Tessaracoccus caeni]|uniref:ABC transporter substrate-binding protein n=1 Tax=Tessaracoccus caeni TaxID=3031239 RepID=UPI0023D9CA53|nr:ABC transporter substrate-binding protein [Tessaracoccus caeni]MDF1490155.1 ABC transporter substrate-binding protein [Tessaracoccus caeni]
MSKRRQSLRFGVVAALLSALLLSACSTPSDEPSVPQASVLDVGATIEPAGMDPITVDGAATPFVLLYNVYETLVKLDGEGNIKPLLAEEWTRSVDNLVYTFQLDDAAKFADGTPVTAEAVVASFQRILDGDATGQILEKFAPVKSLEAIGNGAVEITLKQPSNRFLFDLTTPAGMVFNPAGMENLETVSAGSGPFVLGEWVQGSKVELRRNENYWATPARFDVVNFRYYADPNAMNTAMLSGQLDIISNLTVPQSLGQFTDEDRYRVLEGTTDGEIVLGFNHENEALAKPEVRQAINHALDKQAIVDSAWAGRGVLLGSMASPNDPWYEDLSDRWPYDPDAAKALLAEAGYESGLTLRLRVPTAPYATAAARVVSAQLAEVGITAQVEELDFNRWLDLVFTKKDYDLTMVAHVEPRDAAAFVREGYYWNYQNPEFADLLAQADAAPAEDEAKIMAEAVRMLADDAAAAWLWLLPNLVITTTDIVGVNQDQRSLSFDLTNIASRS